MATPSSLYLRKDVLLLLPFVLLVVAYLVTFNILFHETPTTFAAALAKAAPIWYLSLYLVNTCTMAGNPLAKGSGVALLLSSVGDVCLVWKHTLFLPGMFFFALAQLCYTGAVVAWLKQGRYSLRWMRLPEFVVVGSLSCLYLLTGIESWVMSLCLLAYTLLLFSMAQLAAQRHAAEGSSASLLSVFGACCFVLSDFLIGVNKWKFDVPLAEFLIMVTYYLAQGSLVAGIVFSKRSSPGPAGR